MTATIVKLTSHTVLEMLGDPAFYRACPTYLFMMDNGQAVSRQYKQLLAKQQQCPACTKKTIDATLGTFAVHTRTAATFDVRLLLPMIEYLSPRLGYVPSAVCLYYKDTSGRQRELHFGPLIPGLMRDALVTEQGGSNAAVPETQPNASSPPGGA